MLVAMHKVTKAYLRETPVGEGQNPAKRGVEGTFAPDHARSFTDQAEIDAYVGARGGAAGVWVAVTLP